MVHRLTVAFVVSFCAFLFPTFAVQCEEYPARPIRIVVPWSAGGVADARVRLLSQRLSQALGKPITVENKPGASGTLGAELVSRASARRVHPSLRIVRRSSGGAQHSAQSPVRSKQAVQSGCAHGAQLSSLGGARIIGILLRTRARRTCTYRPRQIQLRNFWAGYRTASDHGAAQAQSGY